MLLHPTLKKASADAMEDFFNRAISMVPTEAWRKEYYHVAGHEVLLAIAGDALHAFMTEAIRHIHTEASTSPDLTIYVIDERVMGLQTPEAPWSWHTGDREGYFHGTDTERFTINFDQATQSLRVLDRARNTAVHWIRDMSLVPYWERSFPMREILNWWYRDSALQPLHAAAVGIDGKGALIGARGGSGKSSTAITCLLSGMQFAGDDFVLADTECGKAYSLYSIAKLEPHALERFPNLAPPPGTPMIDQNKYQISLSRLVPDGLTRSMDLRVILVPHITHQADTYVSEIDASEACSALMLSTFYLLKGDTRAPFRKISQLASALPTYRLNLGTEFGQIPQVITETILAHG